VADRAGHAALVIRQAAAAANSVTARAGGYNGQTMDLLWLLVDIVLHLDRHLSEVIQQYGIWTYLILFLIVFCETGLVVTPFLPGDSLLFAVGTFAALGALDLGLVIALLSAAAILGDSSNYAIGATIGPRVFRRDGVRFLNRRHLERTHEFYERYGAKTIVIARFVPIVRTFAPFVAGIGRMRYGHFLFYNVAGALLWILSLVLGGYLFGNIPVVRRNFSLVIFAIIILSILPGIIEVWRQRGRAGTTAR
jgi:membrane-associated protein